MKKSIGVSILLILMLVVGFNLPVIAESPINPGGPFVPPAQDVNLSAIMTFDEVEAELLKMEQRSKGLVEVEIAGYTQEGRELYIAKMGWGPVRMWIQGRIHGNEPYGNDVCLELIKSLLSSDREILEEMTTFSIGIPVWPEDLDPQIYDDSRRMAVVGYDAVKDLGFCNPSRYPLINIHTAVISSMMLGNPGPGGYDAEWESAAMFFENRGGIGNKSRGYIIKQSVEAVHAFVDAIACGELGFVEPDRWEDIPDRGRSIRRSDKWPDEWAE